LRIKILLYINIFKLLEIVFFMKDLKIGKYQHYKGNFYEVIGVGRHSETLDELVIYRALYNSKEFGKNVIWVRPKEMLLEKVIVDNKEVPRFKFIG